MLGKKWRGGGRCGAMEGRGTKREVENFEVWGMLLRCCNREVNKAFMGSHMMKWLLLGGLFGVFLRSAKNTGLLLEREAEQQRWKWADTITKSSIMTFVEAQRSTVRYNLIKYIILLPNPAAAMHYLPHAIAMAATTPCGSVTADRIGAELPHGGTPTTVSARLLRSIHTVVYGSTLTILILGRPSPPVARRSPFKTGSDCRFFSSTVKLSDQPHQRHPFNPFNPEHRQLKPIFPIRSSPISLQDRT
ncbi:hypothetical protein PIB30_051277 [Stylosanthes scabra]|uniref:Uncharacterized protein n=1 Tax=Stylosanthes scabra TaxID=79078 RepID=A0ABU6TID0_9FABA|nr:hypothetical protein [Stylosanthes scabra]